MTEHATEEKKGVSLDWDRLVPVGDRLFVEPLEVADDDYEGAIIIPDVAKQPKPTIGRVIAVGEGPWGDFLEPPADVGELILFGRFSGLELPIGQKKLLILRGDDVIAVEEAE